MKFNLRTPFRRQLASWTLVATAGATLVACGGSGSDDVNSSSAPITTPPVSAAASVPPSAVVDVTAFVSYLNTLAVNDAQEPLLTDSVTPPVNENGEPILI